MRKEEIDRIIESDVTRLHFDRIKALIEEEGADVDQVGPNDFTLLAVAAWRGDLECVKYLIQKGANIQYESIGGTILHLACINNHLSVVKYLIMQSGTRIDAPDGDYRTSLHWASHRGHVCVVKVLLEMGANHTVRDCFGFTPLQMAEAEGHARMANLLREHNQDKIAMGKERRRKLLQRQEN